MKRFSSARALVPDMNFHLDYSLSGPPCRLACGRHVFLRAHERGLGDCFDLHSQSFIDPQNICWTLATRTRRETDCG